MDDPLFHRRPPRATPGALLIALGALFLFAGMWQFYRHATELIYDIPEPPPEPARTRIVIGGADPSPSPPSPPPRPERVQACAGVAPASGRGEAVRIGTCDDPRITPWEASRGSFVGGAALLLVGLWLLVRERTTR